MKEIGERIRAARLQKGLTLEELAAQTGLSVSFISQVERGISSPSIVSLYSICKALEIPVTRVLAEGSRAPSTVTKADQQLQIRISNSAVSYCYLSGAFPERVIEVLINEFPPNYHHPLAPHEGEEFGYVLEGHLVLKIEEEHYPLGPGDSYHFLATKPHGYETAEEGARVLMATTQKFIEWHSEAKKESFSKGKE